MRSIATSLLCGLSLLATLAVGADPSYTQIGSRLVQPYATGKMGDLSASSISGDGLTIAFGAPGANWFTGLVFLYNKSGDTVTFTDEIAPPGESRTVSSQEFGAALALNWLGNVLVVGSPREASDQGYVYVFDKTNNIWRQTARIRPTETGSGYYFGSSVAVSDDGNVFVVGSATNFFGMVSNILFH